MNEEAIQALYDDVSVEYEVGTIEDFKAYLQDEGKRKSFYEEIIQPNYDVESYESFSESYGLSLGGDSAKKSVPQDEKGSTSVSEESVSGRGEIPTDGGQESAITKARNLRKTSVQLEGYESPSTVLMESAEWDGKYYAYPTLFPKDPENYSSDPEDWMQLDSREAQDEAMKRGELFEFDTEEEAEKFAKGSWKDGGQDLDTTQESSIEEAIEFMSSQPEEEFGVLGEFMFPQNKEEFREESIARKEEFEQEKREEKRAEEERLVELQDITEEEINADIDKVDENLQFLQESTESFNERVKAFNKSVQQGVEPTEQEVKDLDIESTVLNVAIQAQLNKKEDLIRDRFLKRSTKGTFVGAAVREFTQGAGQLLEGTARIASYIPTVGGFSTGQSMRDLFGEENVDKKIAMITPLMEASLYANSIMKDEFFGKEAAKTTRENIEKRYQDSDLQAAALSLAKTAPAMATGTPGLIIQSAEMGYDMIDEAAGDKLTADQKAAYGAAYGIVVGSLERLGLLGTFAKNKTQVGKFVNSVVSRMIQKGEKFSQEGVERVVKEFTAPLLRGAMSEGATEGAQELATIGMESLVNQMAGEGIFEEPENSREALGRIWDSFRIGAVAGGVMGSLPALGSGLKATAEEIKMAREAQKDVADIYDYIDVKVEKGEITPEEGQELKQQTAAADGILKEIPQDLTPQQQAEAFELVAEKKKLEQDIEGKDKNLTLPKQERIKAINERLQEIVQPSEQTTEQDNKAQAQPTERKVETEEDVQVSEVPVQEEVRGDVTQMTYEELNKEWIDLENERGDDAGVRFGEVERELERRERDFILQAPLSDVSERADKLIEQEKSGDLGTFADLSELREAKKVADKYSDASNISDSELKSDVKKSLLNGSPTTNLADAMRFREAHNELSKRGYSFKEILGKYIDQFLADGFTEQDALNIVRRKLEPILQGAKTERQPQKTQQDAIQEQETESVDVREQTEVSEEVEQEVREQGEEVQQETEEVETKDDVEGGENKRRFAARAQEFGKTSKQKILDRPEFYYTPQQLSEMKGKMEEMSDEELAKRMGDESLFMLADGSDNFSILAGVELLKRKIARGENAGELAATLAKRGTAIAQLLRQFAELKSTTPEGFYVAVRSYIESQGVDLSGKNKATKGRKQSKSERRKKAANLAKAVRKAKFVQTQSDLSKLQSDPTGLFKAAWDGAVEAVATAIEAGAFIADAIESGVEYIKGSEWYNKLSEEGKQQAEKIAREGFEQEFKEATPQELKLQRLTTDYMEAMQEFNNLNEAYLQDYNSVRPKDIAKARKQAEAKMKELDKYMNQILPKSWGDLFGQLVQGNLLTTTSQIVNITANVGQIFLNAGVDFFGEGMRRFTIGIGYVLGKKPSSKSMVPLFDIRAYLYAAKQGGVGIKEAFKAIVNGTKPIDNNFEYQMNRGLMPLRAFYVSISGTKLGDMFGIPKGLMRETENSLDAFNERAKKFTEAALGLPAEVMFRLLNLGDAPFYRFAQGKEIYSQARASGLKGEELKAFLKYPSKEMIEKAEPRARQAVFQEESRVSRGVQQAIRKAENVFEDKPILGDVWKFFFRTQVPYVRTPTNIIVQTLDFAIPAWSAAQAADAARQGNIRKMSEYVGKAVMGVILAKTAEYLIANDLIVGALYGDDDEREREKRERGLAYQTQPPNTINVSALKRFRAGGDTTPQEGDEYFNYTKFGIPSVILQIYANSDDKVRRAKRKKGRGVIFDKTDITDIVFGWQQVPETFKVSLEQSFLSGTNTLLNAISGSEYDRNKWITSTWRAASTVALPNTLSAINRTQVEYYPDLRSDDLETQLVNVIKDRTFNTDDLPARVDLSGEPILMTPEGENPFTYHLFDVTKGATIQNADRWLKLRELYFDTQDYKVIPTMPRRTISTKKYKDQSLKLSFPEYNDFAAEAQKMKMEELDKVLNNRRYESWDNERKSEKIRRAYEKASSSREYRKLKERYEQKIKKRIDQELAEDNANQ